MITRRLAVVVALVGTALLAVLLLPKSSAQPTGLRLVDGNPTLPYDVEGWIGTDLKISEIEVKTLGEETKFSRKSYVHPSDRSFRLASTIVLSGRDISTSLHRPERCLNAQGWAILSSDVIPIRIDDQRTFDVRRLHVKRTQLGPDGKTVRTDEAFNFYWYVGEHLLTANHFERFLTDNRDRLFRGVDQRWAYVTVFVEIHHFTSGGDQDLGSEDADREGRSFIKRLAPLIHGDNVEYR